MKTDSILNYTTGDQSDMSDSSESPNPNKIKTSKTSEVLNEKPDNCLKECLNCKATIKYRVICLDKFF